jgi:hypothetical protein
MYADLLLDCEIARAGAPEFRLPFFDPLPFDFGFTLLVTSFACLAAALITRDRVVMDLLL